MKHLDTGLFPAAVALCLCPKDWARDMNAMGGECGDTPFPDDIGATTGFVTADGGYSIVVTFSRDFLRQSLIERISLVAHEATHVWKEMLAYMGEKSPGEEIEACGVQWITRWLLEQLEKAGWLKR